MPRSITVPGVGQRTALAFAAAVDDPERFKRSRDLGAYLGLVPRRYQSGEVDLRKRARSQSSGMIGPITTSYLHSRTRCLWTAKITNEGQRDGIYHTGSPMSRELQEYGMSYIRSAVLIIYAASATLAFCLPGAAQNYPTQQIRLIVPFAAGGASDAVARILADKLGSQLGGRLLVDNRPGAGGNIGTDIGAKSGPDGHTLLFSTSGPLAVNKWLFPKLPYDPERDLEPISLVATLPNVLVVNPQMPVSTTTDFINYAKERPDQISYSSIGNGSSQHLAGVLFESVTGVRLQHVPYKAAGQFVVDLMSGDVPASFQLIPNVLSQLKSGKIKPIAVMSKERSKALPTVPTMAEQGVPNLESAAWFGVLAPKGTSKHIIDRLHAEVVKAVSDPEVQTRLIEIGADPATSSPAEFKSLIAAEAVKWRDLITSMDIKAD